MRKSWTDPKSPKYVVEMDDVRIYASVSSGVSTSKDALSKTQDNFCSLSFADFREISLTDGETKIKIRYDVLEVFSIRMKNENLRHEIFEELKSRFPEARFEEKPMSLFERGQGAIIALLSIAGIYLLVFFQPGIYNQFQQHYFIDLDFFFVARLLKIMHQWGPLAFSSFFGIAVIFLVFVFFYLLSVRKQTRKIVIQEKSAESLDIESKMG